MQGAIFRPMHIAKKQDRLSLDICSLGELLDMYYAQKATKRYDKVHALLGMSSDDRITSLGPDYSSP
jgi:hypothetical protein